MMLKEAGIVTDREITSLVLGHLNADFQSAVLAPGGQMLVGDAPPAEQAVASYTVRSAGLPLQLRVWPTDPAALRAQVNRQQTLYGTKLDRCTQIGEEPTKGGVVRHEG